MYIWFCNVPLRINSEIKCCILCHSCVTSIWKACMLVVVHLIIYLCIFSYDRRHWQTLHGKWSHGTCYHFACLQGVTYTVSLNVLKLQYGEWEATGCHKSTPECNKQGCKTDLPQLLPSPLRKSEEQLHCQFSRLSCGSLLFPCIQGNVRMYHLQHPAEGQTCTDCRHIKKEG